MGDNDHRLESLWTRRSGWLAVAVAAVVSTLEYLMDRLLGMPMLLFSSAITGIVAGGLFYQLARHEKAQRETMRARMTTIAEMNHHIRNALQVIRGLSSFPPEPGNHDEQIQLINESVERVEWALREVLPKYPAGDIAPPPPIGHRHLVFPNRSTTKAGRRART